MAIQYVDGNADAAGSTGDTYNIGATNDQLSVAIDGGSNQVFTLTHGATQSATNVVADINGANGNTAITGATCSVVTVNGVNYVRIRTTSANNASSTILFNAPSNNANATLGFIATTYTGGTNVNTTFVTSSKQDVISGIEDQLNAAGWVTISGHHSTPCLVQSSMTPSNQNLRMRVRMTTGGTNCTIISVENVAGTKAGTNSGNSNGIFLLPGSGKTWRIICNKYQAFVLVAGSTTGRDFGCWGVPYLPSWLAGGTVYEAIWASGNMSTDSDSARGSFRTVLGNRDNASLGTGNFTGIVNGNLWEMANNNGTNNIGQMSLIGMGASTQMNLAGSATHFRWHDASSYMTDPIISWGLTASTDEGMGRGQFWDAFTTEEAYAIDTTLSAIDSHNWWCITANNTGANSNNGRGSLFVVAP